MASNDFIASVIQRRIDTIVEDAPKLFRRLSIVLVPSAIWNLINIANPVLGRLRQLIIGDTSQISPPITDRFVTNEAVNRKRAELNALKNEVIVLFESLQTILVWIIVVDLCRARSQIVLRQDGDQDEIRILEMYTDYVEARIDERQREQRRREIEPSSSSDDSCNLQFD